MGVLEGLVCEIRSGTPWPPGWASRRTISKIVRNSVLNKTVFRDSGARTGRAAADAAAGAAEEARRWVGVMEGPAGAPLAVSY